MFSTIQIFSYVELFLCQYFMDYQTSNKATALLQLLYLKFGKTCLL
jgi:hypothetical protein